MMADLSALARRWQLPGLGALVMGAVVVVAFALRPPPPPLAMDSTLLPSASLSEKVSASTSPTASGEPEASAASPSAVASQGPASTTVPAGSTVAFLGDSLAAGAGASTPDRRWTSVLGAANGWIEVNSAHAQTGYVKSGSLGACTPQVCRPYVEEVPDVITAKPELVVITGGANDLGRDLAAVRAAVARTFADLRSGLPNARLVVVNPWWDLRPDNPLLADLTEIIKAEAQNAGVIWLDTGQPLKNPELMQADGVQPNDAGHEALAQAVASGLREAALTPPTP